MLAVKMRKYVRFQALDLKNSHFLYFYLILKTNQRANMPSLPTVNMLVVMHG